MHPLIYSYDFNLIITDSDCCDLQVRLDISTQASKKTEQTSDEKQEIYQNLSIHGSLKVSFPKNQTVCQSACMHTKKKKVSGIRSMYI